MKKHRILITHSASCITLCYIPQVRKFFVWWTLNSYGQIHAFSRLRDKTYGDSHLYELTEQQAHDAIAIHKKLGTMEA